MPAIDKLMRRLGYVRLSHYGLVLTPEGRVLSLRPAVLDDGLGGRIVGWPEGDLAAMELEKWEPARPASPQAMTNRVAVVPPRPPVPTRAVNPAPTAPAPDPAVAAPKVVNPERAAAIRAPLPVAPAPVAVAPVAAPVPSAPLNVQPEVAPTPEVGEDEDEWEWIIAIARARAAAEASPVVVAPASAARRRGDTVPPPPGMPGFVPTRTQPMARVAARPDPIQDDSWPKTEPLTSIDYNDYTNPTHEVVRVIQRANTPRVPLAARPAEPPKAAAPPKAVEAPTAAEAPKAAAPPKAAEPPKAALSPAPRTVIPVPNLPSAGAARIAPVVRTTGPMPVPPRRMAKGTGPHLPKLEGPAPRAISDDTIPNLPLNTAPLPSVKRLPRG